MKLTISSDVGQSVRCTGKLRCECGAEVKASDVDIDEHDETLTLKIICEGCHRDALVCEVVVEDEEDDE